MWNSGELGAQYSYRRCSGGKYKNMVVNEFLMHLAIYIIFAIKSFLFYQSIIVPCHFSTVISMQPFSIYLLYAKSKLHLLKLTLIHAYVLVQNSNHKFFCFVLVV